MKNEMNLIVCRVVVQDFIHSSSYCFPDFRSVFAHNLGKILSQMSNDVFKKKRDCLNLNSYIIGK